LQIAGEQSVFEVKPSIKMRSMPKALPPCEGQPKKPVARNDARKTIREFTVAKPRNVVLEAWLVGIPEQSSQTQAKPTGYLLDVVV
jgi:hypothetical protein